MPRGRRCALVVAAALSLAARPAAADSIQIGASTVEVNIEAGPEAGCPSEATFREAVRAAVTTPPAGATDALPASHFEVLITADRHGATSTVTSRSEGSASSQRRTVRGATCREVAEAVALIVILSIDPLADPIRLPLVGSEPATGAGPPPSSPAPPPVPPGPEPAAPGHEPPRARTPQASMDGTAGSPRARPVRLGAMASGGAIVGLLPGAAPLVEGALVVMLPTPLPLELRVGAGAFLPDDRAVGSAAVDFWGLRARGAFCPVWHTGADGTGTTLGACAGATFDWIFTHAHGFPRVTSTGLLVPSVTTGGFASYDFGAHRRWSVGLDADLGFVLTATSWTVIDLGEVGHTSPVTGRLGAFVRVNFP